MTRHLGHSSEREPTHHRLHYITLIPKMTHKVVLLASVTDKAVTTKLKLALGHFAFTSWRLQELLGFQSRDQKITMGNV